MEREYALASHSARALVEPRLALPAAVGPGCHAGPRIDGLGLWRDSKILQEVWVQCRGERRVGSTSGKPAVTSGAGGFGQIRPPDGNLVRSNRGRPEENDGGGNPSGLRYGFGTRNIDSTRTEGQNFGDSRAQWRDH